MRVKGLLIGTVSLAAVMASATTVILAAGFTPIRVNAGGPAYTDSLVRTWSTDPGTAGVNTYTTSNSIAATTDPALYQTERFGGAFQYQYTVPNGVYTVNLKFAEIWWTLPGQRVFNVAINSASVLSNFDIVAQAGPFTALDKSFTVNVTTGQITIQFTSVVEFAKVSGIEIFAASSATRVNMGGAGYTDPAGQVWTAGACSGTNPYSSSSPISGTTSAALYQSECFGNNFQYQYPVSNGIYTVNLKFAELWWTQANQRVFNVAINGNTVLSNLDVLARAGGKNIALIAALPFPSQPVRSRSNLRPVWTTQK